MISAHQLSLLNHALGLRPDRREPFRNHFVAGDGHHDQSDLLALVDAGMMTRRDNPEWMGGGDVFHVSDAGTEYAIAHLPAPPKRTRYQEYLDSESCDSFGKWLMGWDLPAYESDYGSFSSGRLQYRVRMKSRRATGEYCDTKKAAKASYKAALAASRLIEVTA
nr:MAG TPA: hypothetical protein [Caudoviricetes sp.]